MNYKRVLVIDDAKIDRYMAEKIMKKYDFTDTVVMVESAMDGLELLEACLENPGSLPELIFLDINMPQMSGFDFLDEYARFPEHIKKKCIIIMLSSSIHPEDKYRAMESPYVYKFLSKPLNADKLQEVSQII
ncbi:response regulator [Sphingobacterium alkalisoli]|uniref:Response regulator n=1 Tax=Sphingobacterium alkalisoli TaxID=1874115 RepID=A0A4U0H034_9SPHI|nr:response regulator [Sphingobacterium alkalisoli]TJY64364.1 response regulator [Sphingobacterium alkalisoli]GGH22193.1 response regulator [Sphingobacterium alkalisoli]